MAPIVLNDFLVILLLAVTGSVFLNSIQVMKMNCLDCFLCPESRLNLSPCIQVDVQSVYEQADIYKYWKTMIGRQKVAASCVCLYVVCVQQTH